MIVKSFPPEEFPFHAKNMVQYLQEIRYDPFVHELFEGLFLTNRVW